MRREGHRLGIFYSPAGQINRSSILPSDIAAFDLGSGCGLSRARRALSMALPLRDTADIYYSNSNGLINVLIGWALRPRIWIHHHHLNYEVGDLKKWSALERWQMKRVTHVIMCSPVHAGRMAIDLGSRAPVFVPYLKIEGAKVGSLTASAKRTLGYFGLLRRAKGVPFLLGIGSWLEKRGLTLRIHGRDEERLCSGRQHPNIELYGEYNQATDLEILFQQVGVAVVPSEEGEGLPLVISEALSRGIPVVAFQFAGISWLKGRIPGFRVIDVGDYDGYLAAVVELLARTEDLSFRDSIKAAYHEILGNQICERWWEQIIVRGQPRVLASESTVGV